MISSLIIKYNLPFTQIVVWNNGKSVVLENVLVDTGVRSHELWRKSSQRHCRGCDEVVTHNATGRAYVA